MKKILKYSICSLLSFNDCFANGSLLPRISHANASCELPHFFILEKMILLLANCLKVAVLIWLALEFLAVLGLALGFMTIPYPAPSFLIPFFTVLTVVLAMFASIHLFAHRAINVKQLAWVNDNCGELGLPAPTAQTNKQMLKNYLEAVQAARETPTNSSHTY